LFHDRSAIDHPEKGAEQARAMANPLMAKYGMPSVSIRRDGVPPERRDEIYNTPATPGGEEHYGEKCRSKIDRSASGQWHHATRRGDRA